MKYVRLPDLLLDLQAATSDRVKSYIQEHDIELITYRDIKGELL